MSILNDPETPFEKRCYDEKDNNICKAPLFPIIKRELCKQALIMS